MSHLVAPIKLELAIPLVVWKTWEREGLTTTLLERQGLVPPAVTRWPSAFRARFDASTQALIVEFEIRIVPDTEAI